MLKFKSTIKKQLCVFLCAVFAVSVLPVCGVAAERKPDSILTNNFVAESKTIRTTDESGDPVIILEHNDTKYNLRQSKTENAKTMIAFFPEDNVVANAMMESINNLTRGSGTHTEDDWFYASSVHVTSTIYYTSKEVNLYRFASISKVVVSLYCNNGTTVPSLVVLLGQVGIDENGKMQTNQRKEISSTTPGTFYPPSSWVSINLDAGVSNPLVANVTITAKRASATKTFTLYNSVH